MGRPTKYSASTMKKICDGLRLSNTRRVACVLAGISQDTFAVWQKQHPDFAEAVEMAEAQGQAHLVAILMKSWTPQSAQWLLSRRWPSGWGAKVEAAEATAPAAIDLSADERLRRIEELLSTAAARAVPPGRPPDAQPPPASRDQQQH